MTDRDDLTSSLPISSEPKRPYEPSYSFLHTYIEKRDGEFDNGPDLCVCDECGAAVGDQEAHDEWHRTITRASQ